MSAPLVPLVAARDRAIARLSDAFAGDLLELEVFEDRVNRAHRATDLATLDALVVDLPVSSSAAPAPRTAIAIRPAGGGEAKVMRAVFGGIDRRGPWSMPQKLKIVAVFGGVDLDLREADFAPGETELVITAAFGGVDIKVPPGLAVEMDGSAYFGGFEHMERSSRQRDPSAPLLRIRGTVIFGGVSVQTRLPGESRRQARQRERREQRELTSRSARELPKGPSDDRE